MTVEEYKGVNPRQNEYFEYLDQHIGGVRDSWKLFLAPVFAEYFPDYYSEAQRAIELHDSSKYDEEEFDAYYDKLDDWNEHHRWHPASSGAILADLYFQLVGDNVEISWNNEDAEEGVEFTFKVGGCKIPVTEFKSVINSFLKEYALHWF